MSVAEDATVAHAVSGGRLNLGLRHGRTGFTGRRFRTPDGPYPLRTEVPVLVGATGGPALDRAVRLAEGLLTYSPSRRRRSRYADYLEAFAASRPRPRGLPVHAHHGL